MSSAKKMAIITATTLGVASLMSMSAATNAEMMFKYKSPSTSSISSSGEDLASPECYEPDNVGTIGNAPGCEGMLIVDDYRLRVNASHAANRNGGYASFSNPEGGFPRFYVSHGGEKYTFEDSDKNIFTGQVEDMSYLFYDVDYTGDIGYWDVSSATNMDFMFEYSVEFNPDISSWNVSSVTSMVEMFKGHDRKSHTFDQDISSWDVSNVTDMRRMFIYNYSFDQNLTSWNVENVQYHMEFNKNSSLSDENIPADFR